MNRRAVIAVTGVAIFILATRIATLLRFGARPGGDANLAVYWGNDVLTHRDLHDVEQAWEVNEQTRDYSRQILYVLAALPSTISDADIMHVVSSMSIVGSLALSL